MLQLFLLKENDCRTYFYYTRSNLLKNADLNENIKRNIIKYNILLLYITNGQINYNI